MNAISRRAFVKVGAVATIGAAVPAAMATSELVEGIAVLDDLIAPVAKYPFEWWVSFDGGELFSDSFASREEAARYAEYMGGGLIAECQQQDFDLRVTDDDLFHIMEYNNQKEIGEGDFIEWTNEQGEELQREVNAVILAWAERHKINGTAWTLGSVRNREQIAPLPEIEKDAAQ